MKDFTSEITEALKEYSSSCDEQIQAAIQDVAKQAQKRLTATSPARSGKYKRSWKVKLERRPSYCKVHIHNTRYQLTHLLEFGHRVRGGRASARPHIAAVEQWAVAEAEKRIKEVLSG